MSTYLYLECLDHDPPLQSPDEVGQHLYDLPRIREILANLDANVAASRLDSTGEDYFTRNAMQFLRIHSRCNLGIRDEYGVEHSVKETP